MKVQELDELELGLDRSQWRSRHRRELVEMRRARRRHLRRGFAPFALVGLGIVIALITKDTLTPRDQTILVLSALLIVPWLATFQLLD